MSMGMDLLRRSGRCSRLEKIRNNFIRQKMNIKNSVSDYIKYKQLNWYGHVQKWTKKGSLEEFWNGAHLEDEEREDLENRGCRRLQ